MRLTSNSVYDRDCTEFPVCPCFIKKPSSLSRLGLQDAFPSWLEQQSSSTLFTTQWYPAVMCSETWNSPVFGVLGAPWPPALGKRRGHAGSCRLHGHTAAWFPVWEFMVLLVVGVVNSISHWIFPPSECTGDLWCTVVLLVSCGWNTQLVSVESRAVLLSWILACINQFVQAFFCTCSYLREPQCGPGAELWAWCSCPAQVLQELGLCVPSLLCWDMLEKKKNIMGEDVQETWRTGCFHSDTFLWNSIWSSDLSLFTAVENNHSRVEAGTVILESSRK